MKSPLGFWFIVLNATLAGFIDHLSRKLYSSEGAQILFSYVGPASSILATIYFVKNAKPGVCSSGRKWGAFIGGQAYAVLHLWIIYIQYTEIKTDGTAYWAFITLPSIYFGLSLPILGLGLGSIIDFIKKNCSNKATQRTLNPRRDFRKEESN